MNFTKYFTFCKKFYYREIIFVRLYLTQDFLTPLNSFLFVFLNKLFKKNIFPFLISDAFKLILYCMETEAYNSFNYNISHFAEFVDLGDISYHKILLTSIK